MSVFRNFFQKRRLDRKFKEAGTGHRLTGDTPSTACGFRDESRDGGRAEKIVVRETKRSESSLKAAEAALSRTANQVKQKRPILPKATWKNTTLNAELSKEGREGNASEIKQMAASGRDMKVLPFLSTILFACPLCPLCFSEAEIRQHIEKCLQEDISSDPAMVATAMIHTLNDPKRVISCIEILNKYLDNIIKYPYEEKYWKIRVNNKVFQDKVQGIKGVKELLTMAIGFVQVKLPRNDGEGEEDFYLLSEGIAIDTERLEIIKEYLNEAEALIPSLDRNAKVYKPVSAAAILEFPDDFYSVSNEEMQREQQEKKGNLEKSLQLRTKAMKDIEVQQKKRFYRFTLIRIKFPDDLILEGTFFSTEKFKEVVSFVRDSLEIDWLQFKLFDSMRKLVDALESSLEMLELSPAAILNFRWDQEVAEDVERVIGNPKQFLSSELLASAIEL